MTKIPTQPAAPTWTFRARLRRGAFGWKGSRLAIGRIDEALSEIRAVARHDLASAAEGAVLFLEKISPALSQVDSSSGALGSATYSYCVIKIKALSALLHATDEKRWVLASDSTNTWIIWPWVLGTSTAQLACEATVRD